MLPVETMNAWRRRWFRVLDHTLEYYDGKYTLDMPYNHIHTPVPCMEWVNRDDTDIHRPHTGY